MLYLLRLKNLAISYTEGVSPRYRMQERLIHLIRVHKPLLFNLSILNKAAFCNLDSLYFLLKQEASAEAR